MDILKKIENILMESPEYQLYYKPIIEKLEAILSKSVDNKTTDKLKEIFHKGLLNLDISPKEYQDLKQGLEI